MTALSDLPNVGSVVAAELEAAGIADGEAQWKELQGLTSDA